MNRVDAVVVGGGFGGLACAAGLARAGVHCVVLERKRVPGQAMHTTGILVKEAAEALDLPESIVRPIRSVRLYSPRLRSAAIQSSNYFFLTTDTPALMKHFSRGAEKDGAELRYDCPFRGARFESDELVLPDASLRCRWLIGADGPRSAVARALGLGQNQRFLAGAEIEFESLELPDPDSFYCFLDSRLAPGYIGWVIPGVGTTQVGLAAREPVRPDLDAFLQHIAPLFDLSGARIRGRRGGLIPVGGVVRPVARGGALLLGDAAGTVSPLTAGGIRTAIHYGAELADSIVAYERGAGPHPARFLEGHYPRFRLKRGMRWVLERAAPDWLLDALIGSRAFEAMARVVFFQESAYPRGSEVSR